MADGCANSYIGTFRLPPLEQGFMSEQGFDVEAYLRQAQVRAFAAMGMTIPWTGTRNTPDPDHPDVRAHKLLLRLLTSQQRSEYEAHRVIWVRSEEGKKTCRYQLSYNDLQVRVFDYTGTLRENWCAFIPNAPREDTLVAQLLTLRNNPDQLRRAAQVTVYSEDGEYKTTYPPSNPRAARRAAVARFWDVLRRAGYS